MRIRKSLFSTLLFVAILLTGIIVLYFMTRNIFNNPDIMDSQSSITVNSEKVSRV